ncbi:T4-like DNA polymerase [Pseudomonas phage OBP]|uniref:DNA polymerase n=1 Tax=Pseudomonas phage OBP TaxID=1124849 RepID=UPI000240D634|nr:DNA polymerase [Pseudomonas phage OBP]AEV89492.1 T4-like DNA polymerase [Pseudomonas phage OBP]
MSGVGPFLSENYESDRNLLKHAISQYSMMVSRSQGLDEDEVKRNFVEFFKGNKDKFKSLRAKVIVKNKMEDREMKILPLSSVFKYVQEKNYHLSPSMVAYTHSDEEECVNSIGTRLFIDNRSYYKQLMQKARDAGDNENRDKYKEIQNAFKIFNNAQSGAMSSEGTPINNKTGHTSLTSTCRCLTSTANLINEQFIAGNHFYNTPENTLQSIMARLQVTDYKLLESVMEKYKLHYATTEDLMESIHYCSRRYWTSAKHMAIIEHFLMHISPLERSALLYTLDLVSLFKHNKEFVSGFFDEWVSMNPPEEGKTEKDYLAPDNGDKYVLCVSKLHRKPSKVEVNALNTRHMEVEAKYSDFMKIFFNSPIPPSGLFDVTSSIRDCVLTSDTDSSIYTVDEMIEAYTHDREKGVNLNGVLTYFIRMISVDQHQQLSANLNVAKKNLRMLGMKNEYYFGAYVTTLMSKHYYASQQMVEGVRNSEPEMEIKGVHLKSSKIASNIKDFAQKLMGDTLDAIEHKKKLSPAETLKEIGDLERTIVDDIQAGDWKWLSRQGVKGSASYSKPMASVYFYHELWENVFAEKYGPAPELPYTGVKMSVDLGSKTKVKEFIERLEDKALADRFLKFMESTGRTDLGNLVVPMERMQFLADIPIEIKQAIDYRTVIKQNLKCVYEVLNSTGLYFMNDSISRLVSDEH